MLFSRSKKFIFVHIYKTGGTSVTQMLQKYNYNFLTNQLPFRLLNSLLARTGSEYRIWAGNINYIGLLGCHQHATAFHIKNCLPDKIFLESFKFAFVRNPWSWQVSIYNHIKLAKHHVHHKLVNSFSDFSEYLRWRIQEDKHLQSEFVTDINGKYLVDYIGRLETIESDLDKICSVIGIETPKIIHLNKKLNKNDYVSYYTKESQELLANAFASDIERFGYSFDKYSSQPIIDLG